MGGEREMREARGRESRAEEEEVVRFVGQAAGVVVRQIGGGKMRFHVGMIFCECARQLCCCFAWWTSGKQLTLTVLLSSLFLSCISGLVSVFYAFLKFDS